MARQQISTISSMTLFTFIFLTAILALHAHAQTHKTSSGHVGGERGQSQSLSLNRILRGQDWEEERGLENVDLDNLLSRYALATRLLGMVSRNNKRAGWKRIPIQTRFAPFGTKLIPSRSRGDSTGPTLLRYGRSSA
ncbi:hypothetical protein ACOMHN_044700 [Nucella lapillus]